MLAKLQVILLGNQGTGKTALLRRYVADEFDPEASRATNGVRFSTRVLRIDGKRVKGQIWDTQGESCHTAHWIICSASFGMWLH